MGIKTKKLSSKMQQQIRRKKRVRKKVSGTKERPRLAIFKSLKHLYAQIIDDIDGKTLVFVTTNTKDFKEKHKSCKNVIAAKELGKLLGEKAKENKIEKVVFDRNIYKYHGKVKAFADAVRECGIKF